VESPAPLTSGDGPQKPVPYTADEMAEMMATAEWHPGERLARLMGKGFTLTISVAPTAIIVWALAPEELRYELRKLARWLPWGVRYALWWLKQEGL
jgi:hypothetical protein